MIDLSSYALSAVLLAVLGLSVGFVAFRLRRQLLPEWGGAPARLVESVLAVALLIWLCEMLGLLGILYASTLVIEAVLLVAGIAAWSVGAGRSEGDVAPSPPPASRGMSFVAIAAVAVVFAHWGLFLKPALDHGISNFDSLWSYMPFAARMAQSHSVIDLHFTNTAFTNLDWFYPQNSELLHAVGILFTHRDTLSLFINFGWLAFAFLAAWCIGRPFGRAPLCVIAAAIVLECDTLIVRAPGAAKDDVMAAALLLAAIAIVLNARAQAGSRALPEAGVLTPGWGLAAAGLAAGLAVGTKATVLAMVAVLSVAAIVLVPRGRRWAGSAWWLLPAIAGCGFWYLRNLVTAGNPLPQVERLGPISLPHPQQIQHEFPAFSILHYATDTAVWREYFGPGLELALGTLWPLVIAGALAGGVLALISTRDAVLRWLGGAVLIGGVAYMATPFSAAGAAGAPFEFWINVRYAIPPLLTGLVLLPLYRGFGGSVAQWALLGALLAVLVLTDDPGALLHDHERLFGLLVATVMVLIPAGLLLLRRWGGSNRELALSVGLFAVLLVVIGYPLQRQYLRDRFGPDSGLPGQQLNSAYLWARGVQDARIGVVGTTAGFYQYGFYGTDLSNHVTYLGERGPGGAFNPIPSCDAFRTAVNDANLGYLVTAPFLNFFRSTEPIESPEAGWLRGSRAVEPIDRSGPVTIWRVKEKLDPAACGPENAPLRFVPQQPEA